MHAVRNSITKIIITYFVFNDCIIFLLQKCIKWSSNTKGKEQIIKIVYVLFCAGIDMCVNSF